MSFYSSQNLSRQGPLRLLWTAAHLERQLKRQQVRALLHICWCAMCWPWCGRQHTWSGSSSASRCGCLATCLFMYELLAVVRQRCVYGFVCALLCTCVSVVLLGSCSLERPALILPDILPSASRCVLLLHMCFFASCLSWCVLAAGAFRGRRALMCFDML
jgi:hypothetical protein